jgi:NAD-specific glutamate dehydrogenase
MSDTVLDAAIEGARKQIDPQDGPALETFARRLLRGVETHPIGGTPALVSMVAESFAWIQQREPDEIRVRARNCPDRPGLTVLELHQDDRPFLLDSVELILARFGVRQRLVVHPTLIVLRNRRRVRAAA